MANLTQCTKGGDENGRPGWNIKFEYDQETVETLKRSVPHTETVLSFHEKLVGK